MSLVLALILILALASGCSGPGSAGTETSDGDKILFTYDDTQVSFKEAWIYTKMVASQQEQMYSMYFGNYDMDWSMVIDENGTTMEDSVKESAVNQIKKIIVLVNKAKDYDCSLTDEDKKACEKYAKAFAKDQTGKGIMEECGAGEEDVRKIYEDNMLAHKVQEAMVKDVDDKVSDDEARVTKVKRVLFETVSYDEKTGEEKELSDKKKEKMKERAEKALKAIQKGDKKIDKVAEENNYQDQMEESYSKGESEEGKKFETAVAKLKDGDILDKVMETEHGYVIAQLIAKTDKEGTQNKKESIIEQRQQDAFDAKYDEWVKDLEKEWDYKKDVDQKLFAQLKLAEAAEEGTTGLEVETEPAEDTEAAPETTEEASGAEKNAEGEKTAPEDSSQADE
jgi:hypothetical protein